MIWTINYDFQTINKCRRCECLGEKHWRMTTRFGHFLENFFSLFLRVIHLTINNTKCIHTKITMKGCKNIKIIRLAYENLCKSCEIIKLSLTLLIADWLVLIGLDFLISELKIQCLVYIKPSSSWIDML